MRRNFIYSAVCLGLLSLTSCATIFTGTTYKITFNSKPEGAKVYYKGYEKCVTPCSFNVNRGLFDNRNKIVELKKEGYVDKGIELDTKFNTVSILNVFAGLVPWGIDVVTGSVMKYDTKNYNVELEKKK